MHVKWERLYQNGSSHVPMALIVGGLLIGIKHRFRNPGWLIIIAIGCINLLDKLIPELNIGNYILPIVIILVGTFFIFRPAKSWRENRQLWREQYRDDWKQHEETGVPASKNYDSDYIDSVSVFGGVKRMISVKEL
ncbi:MAG: hypothetical protein WKG06_04865 [Segetibacter sp.]